MIDINWNPTRRQLRQFAVAFLIFAGIGSGLLWWRFGPGWYLPTLWIAGPIVATVGLLIPKAVKPLFVGMSLLAFPIGFVLGTVLLALTYYIIVTSIGLVFKLLGKDPLGRKLDREAATYWKKRPPTPEPGRYFRQF